jgi:hypothetical protein
VSANKNTKNEYSRLERIRPGDLIQIAGTDIRHKVHSLGDNTVDVEQEAGKDIVIRSRNLWIDPLLPPTDPYYPDITLYEPGEAERFDRIGL